LFETGCRQQADLIWQNSRFDDFYLRHDAGVAGVLFLDCSKHLNTPRAIYDASQQLRWRWDQLEPFGDSAPEENPSSLGVFQCNARFPGQYFDAETNLAYNMARNYDASLGRYVESDPIGVAPFQIPSRRLNFDVCVCQQ
jgi:RHS repeat-associated protein